MYLCSLNYCSRQCHVQTASAAGSWFTWVSVADSVLVQTAIVAGSWFTWVSVADSVLVQTAIAAGSWFTWVIVADSVMFKQPVWLVPGSHGLDKQTMSLTMTTPSCMFVT